MKETAILCYYNTLKEKGCFDFLRLHIQEDVSGILLMSEEKPDQPAVNDMEDMLLGRMEILYAGILISRLNRKMKQYDIVQAVNPPSVITDELRNAASELKGELCQQGPEVLYQEYPLLQGYEQRIRNNYINHMREVLERFCVHKLEIAQIFFGGKVPEKILGLKSSGADMHRKGRCVVHLITDAGECFYKPHDCGLDVFYRQITKDFFSDVTAAPDVVKGDGYAFVSTLVRKETQRPVSEYYYNFGVLAALLHGIGSNDMHGENILPCGDLPCIIDMESVVSTLKKGKDSSLLSDSETEAYFQEIGTSVIRTGLMPMRLHKGGLVSPFYHGEAAENCLPFHDGKTCSIEGYETDFLRGFREGYRRMLENRDAIRSMLDSCRDTLVRIIPFNTVYYVRCRARLFSEEALKSEEVTRKVLKDLEIPFTWYGRAAEIPQIMHEAGALQEGDIPYFCTLFDSHDLFGTDEEEPVQKDYLRFSAREYTEHCLERLSDKELAFEEEMLKRCFANVQLDREVSPEEINWPCVLPVFSCTRDCHAGKPEENKALYEKAAAAAEKTCEEVFEQMLSERIFMVSGLPVWLSFPQNVKNSAGIFGQLSGAFAFASGITDTPVSEKLRKSASEFLTDSRESADRAFEKIKNLDDRALRNQTSLGLSGGLGLALFWQGTAGAKIKRAVQNDRDLAAFLLEKEIWKTEKYDVTEGLAGLILGAEAGRGSCAEKESMSEEKCLNRLICLCADRLSERTLCENADALTGNAGIGAALAAAYRYSGCIGYAEKALKIFTEVKDRYSRSVKGWKENTGILKWAAKRYAVSAGIGLSALKAAEAFDRQKAASLPDDTVIRQVLELSLESLQSEETLYWNDSLYNGNALSVIFLVRAGMYLQKEELLQRAAQIFLSMYERRKSYDYFHVAQRGVRNCFEISFTEGSPGIGYSALMLLRDLFAFR